MVKILLFYQFALLIASSAFAQHPFWLDDAIRVDNPGELAYWTAVDTSCPLTWEEVKTVIEEVLTQNRIEPVGNKVFEDGRIYLNVNIRCASVAKDSKHAFSISIHFGRYKPWPPILFDAPFQEFGVGSKSLILSRFRESVEIAVAAFEKANTITIGKR